MRNTTYCAFLLIVSLLWFATMTTATINIDITIESPFLAMNEYLTTPSNHQLDLPDNLYGLTMVTFHIGQVGPLSQLNLFNNDRIFIEAVGIITDNVNDPWSRELAIVDSYNSHTSIPSMTSQQYCSIFFLDEDDNIKFRYFNERYSTLETTVPYPANEFPFGLVALPYPEDLLNYNITSTDSMSVKCWSQPAMVTTVGEDITTPTQFKWNVHFQQESVWSSHNRIQSFVQNMNTWKFLNIIERPNLVHNAINPSMLKPTISEFKDQITFSWLFQLTSTMSYGEAVVFQLSPVSSQLFFQTFKCEQISPIPKYVVTTDYDLFSQVDSLTSRVSWSMDVLNLYVYLEPFIGEPILQDEPIYSCSAVFKFHKALYDPGPPDSNKMIITDFNHNDGNNNDGNNNNNNNNKTNLQSQQVTDPVPISFTFTPFVIYQNSKAAVDNDVVVSLQHYIYKPSPISVQQGDTFSITIDTTLLYDELVHPNPPFSDGTTVILSIFGAGSFHRIGLITNWQWISDRSSPMSFSVTVDSPMPLIENARGFFISPLFTPVKTYNFFQHLNFDWKVGPKAFLDGFAKPLRVLLHAPITFVPSCMDPSTFKQYTNLDHPLSCGNFGQCNESTGTCACSLTDGSVNFDLIGPSYQQCSSGNCPIMNCGDGTPTTDQMGRCACDCPIDTSLPPDTPVDGFFKNCQKGDPNAVRLRQQFPKISIRPYSLDSNTSMKLDKLTKSIHDRQYQQAGQVIEFDFGSLTDFYNAQYNQVEFFTFNLQPTSLIDTYLPHQVIKVLNPDEYCHWSLFQSPDGFFEPEIQDSFLGFYTPYTNQYAHFASIFDSSLHSNYGIDPGSVIPLTNPLYGVEINDLNTFIRGLSSHSLAQTRIKFHCGIDFPLVTDSTSSSHYQPTYQEYFTFLSGTKANFSAYSRTIRYNPAPKSISIPFQLKLTPPTITPHVRGWGSVPNSNIITLNFDLEVSTILYGQGDVLEVYGTPSDKFSYDGPVCTTHANIVDLNQKIKSIVLPPNTERRMGDVDIYPRYYPYPHPSDGSTPTTLLLRCVWAFRYLGRRSEFLTWSLEEKIAVLFPSEPAEQASFQIKSQFSYSSVPVEIIVPSHEVIDQSINSLFNGNIITFATDNFLTPLQHTYLTDTAPGMIIQASSAGPSGNPQVFTLGIGRYVGYNIIMVEIATTRLTPNHGDNVVYDYSLVYIDNTTIHDSDTLPLQPLNAPNTQLVSYCTSMSMQLDGVWSPSSTGICANNIECLGTTGFCDCQVPTTTFGDICDGQALNNNDDFCSLECIGPGQKPNLSCTECICDNAFACAPPEPNSDFFSIPDAACMTCISVMDLPCTKVCSSPRSVLDETDCQCKCPVPLEQCTTPMIFDETDCQCKCPVPLEECTAPMLFDETDCQCKCPNKTCSGAMSFHNTATCECECPSKTCSGAMSFYNTDTCECECPSKTCTAPQTFHDVENDCECKCPQKTCTGPNTLYNMVTCECECSSIDACQPPQEWDSTTCECKTPSPPPEQPPTQCSLDCRNGSMANDECKSCNCRTDSFFIGQLCDTCSLHCYNQGKANLECDECSCPRSGYSGTYCECRHVSFTLTLGSVPKFLLNEFIADPINGGSSDTAIDFITTQLLQQPKSKLNIQLFSKLTIQVMTLQPNDPSFIGPKSLALSGYVEDNCSISRQDTNYPELQLKWTDFLNSLLTTGLEIDDETIPVIDVEVSYPNIRCDDALDVDCNNVVDARNGTVGFNNLTTSFVLIFVITMFNIWL